MYKLINKTTQEKHICSKVVIDGFDYYVNNEDIQIEDYYIVSNNLEQCLSSYESNDLTDICKKAIATNNPNIDLPQVIDEVDLIVEQEFHIKIPSDETKWKKALWKDGYNKLQLTHTFSKNDMIEFVEWIRIKDFQTTSKSNWIGLDMEYKTSKELLKLWKEQQIKTIYYG